jgi:hypothetical protein
MMCPVHADASLVVVVKQENRLLDMQACRRASAAELLPEDFQKSTTLTPSFGW